MQLNKKINRGFILIISMMIIVTAITSLISFKSSMNTYVEGNRNQEFDKIAEDLTSISSLQGGLSTYALSLYAKNKSIDIIHYDNNGDIKAEYYGLEKNKNKENYVTKIYNMVSYNGIMIGKISISYYDDMFLYNKSLKEFYRETLRNYSLILLFALLIASAFVVSLSTNITNPIRDIIDKTKNMRANIYDTKTSKYNIYELDELQENLNFLSNTLKLQDDFRKNYSQDIAHELRTPLTNLLLHLEGVKDKVISLDDETINLLIKEVKRLNHMVDNLQSTFNETKKFERLKLESVNISHLIKDVVTTFTPILMEKNIKLELKLDDVSTETDRDKFNQIVNNILSNAIKAIDKNGKIVLSLKDYHNRLVISIKDNGVGISEEDLPHIFERFFRVDNVRNSRNSGRGLGLSITKNLLDLLNYNISVNSTPGLGSEFIITIPKQK